MNTKRVELLIYAKGFSSIRQYVEYISQNYPKYCISEDTISNIIKGKGFRIATLELLAKGLGVPLGCLIRERLPEVDGYLFGEVASYIEEWGRCWENENHDLEAVRILYEMDMINYTGQSKYKITTLPELLIYMPLGKMSDLFEAVCRIGGNIENNGQYILNQFNWFYKTIPDSLAKRYADYLLESHRLSDPEDEEAEQALLCDYGFDDDKLYNAAYMEYQEHIDRIRTLFSNDLIREICDKYGWEEKNIHSKCSIKF